jgi:hypothetical protein
MANQRLGNTAQARTAFDQLGTLVRSGRWPNDQEVQVLLREADELFAPASSGKGNSPTAK